MQSPPFVVVMVFSNLNFKPEENQAECCCFRLYLSKTPYVNLPVAFAEIFFPLFLVMVLYDVEHYVQIMLSRLGPKVFLAEIK